MPLDMEASRLFRVLARLLGPCAVKKLMALSRAELTLLPVASLFWVCVIRSEVDCNASRFERTPAERTMSDILRYLSGEFAVLAAIHLRSSGSDMSSHTAPNGPQKFMVNKILLISAKFYSNCKLGSAADRAKFA